MPVQEHTKQLAGLERNLYFKQLQINRLLEVTQAINNNVAAAGLYKIYKDIMSWEMRVKKMMLLFLDDNNKWVIATSIGIEEAPDIANIGDWLSSYTRPVAFQQPNHPLLSQFEVVVPVMHKQTSIAYALLGQFTNADDRYEQIKFITTITNIIAVAIENKRLFKQQLEQERMRHELRLAAQVQSLMVPSKLPSNQHYELASVYMPHEGVGGDYYDFIPLNKDQFIFCIADISGKGIAAALLMSNFQANLNAIAHKRLNPEDFIQILNKTVRRITKGDKFITLFIGLYNIPNRKLTYINAGHIPPLMWMDGDIHSLDKGCTILGAFRKIPSIEVGELTVSPGSIVMTYTDGLSDLMNEADEYLGADLLGNFLSENNDLDVGAYNDKLMTYIAGFKGSRDYPDDISILTCRFF